MLLSLPIFLKFSHHVTVKQNQAVYICFSVILYIPKYLIETILDDYVYHFWKVSEMLE